jgi:hypothetical protein
MYLADWVHVWIQGTKVAEDEAHVGPVGSTNDALQHMT